MNVARGKGRLTPSLLETMLQTMTMQEIAEDTGYSINTVRAYTYGNGLRAIHRKKSSQKGVPKPKAWKYDVPKETLQELYWGQGMSDREIGKLLGVPRKCIWTYRKGHGIPSRGYDGIPLYFAKRRAKNALHTNKQAILERKADRIFNEIKEKYAGESKEKLK